MDYQVVFLVTLASIIGPIIPILYIGKDIKDVVGNPFDFSKFVIRSELH